jgi:hypothetical protein
MRHAIEMVPRIADPFDGADVLWVIAQAQAREGSPLAARRSLDMAFRLLSDGVSATCRVPRKKAANGDALCEPAARLSAAHRRSTVFSVAALQARLGALDGARRTLRLLQDELQRGAGTRRAMRCVNVAAVGGDDALDFMDEEESEFVKLHGLIGLLEALASEPDW